MELKYEKFEQISSDVDQIQSLINEDLFKCAFMPGFLEGRSEEYIESLCDLIYQIGKPLSDDLIDIDFPHEVELNVANMNNDEQVIRYLSFLKSKIITLKEVCESFFINDILNTKSSRAIIFEQTKLGNVEDNDKTYYRFKDPVMALKMAHLTAVEKLIEAIEFIDDKIAEALPKELSESLYELKLDRHKLILLQKTGVFDFLCDKYVNPKAPLMIKEDFKKLIANIIGATTKDIGSDVAKLIAENTDPKKQKSVETLNSTKTVNAFLASLGLSI